MFWLFMWSLFLLFTVAGFFFYKERNLKILWGVAGVLTLFFDLTTHAEGLVKFLAIIIAFVVGVGLARSLERTVNTAK